MKHDAENQVTQVTNDTYEHTENRPRQHPGGAESCLFGSRTDAPWAVSATNRWPGKFAWSVPTGQAGVGQLEKPLSCNQLRGRSQSRGLQQASRLLRDSPAGYVLTGSR